MDGRRVTDPQYDIAEGAREPPDVVSRHAANARWATPGTQAIPEARTHPIGEWTSANEWAEWNPFPVSVPVGVGGVEVEKPNQPGLVRQPSEDGSMGDQNPVRTRTTLRAARLEDGRARAQAGQRCTATCEPSPGTRSSILERTQTHRTHLVEGADGRKKDDCSG